MKKILFLLVISFCLQGCMPTPIKETPKQNQGLPAYDFKLEDIHGKQYAMKDYLGQKVYLEFWASWCPICIDNLPETDKLSTSKDFKVLTIVSPNLGSEKSKEDFKKWFQKKNYKNMIVLFDADAKLSDYYGIRAYPTSLFINTKNEVVVKRPGYATSDEVIETFQQIS